MDVAQNIVLFQELIQCGGSIYTWVYDSQGQLISSNCPDETLFATAFSIMGCKERLLSASRESAKPLLIGTAIGINWGAAFEYESGSLVRCYVIGPVFFSEVSRSEVEYGFSQYSQLEICLAWKHQFFRKLDQIPLAQNMILTRYTLMLHYCLTGQHLDVSDLAISESKATPQLTRGSEDSYKVWHTEQAMLQMVRNGDLNYKDALNASILGSNGVPVHGKDPLRQAKTSIMVFVSIVCRAAIDGGLPPEEAYSLGNYYIQSAESATDYNDLQPIGITMYRDFIQRVHQLRRKPGLSDQIQKCCDYIEMHPEQKLQAADLAALAGYTEYYLTAKFKAETGMSVSEYIKRVRISRAKVRLLSEDTDIRQIAEDLGFNSRTYFSRVFSEMVGCTPVEFRKTKGIADCGHI